MGHPRGKTAPKSVDHDWQRKETISPISCSVKPGTSKSSEISSLRKPVLQLSRSGTGKYFVFFLTVAELSMPRSAPGMPHSLPISGKVCPITVLRSLERMLAKTLTGYFGLESRDFINPQYRLASITLGCRDPDISSIRYLWVVLGTFQACLTATFHAL